jgi:hypothetical protein
MAVRLKKARSSSGSTFHAPEGGVALSQLGQSGLKRSYGYIYEELLPQLMGRKAINVYQEMAQNSTVIGAFLFAIDMFMRKVAWRVEAADQTPKGEKDAKFLSSCKDDMEHTWADFVSEINSMLTFGWSWFEICYKQRTLEIIDDYGTASSKYDDGMIGWKKFMPIAQESWWRWDFDPETGKVIGMWQRPAPDYSERYLPCGKSLHFRTASRKDNPEGVSVLRTAYRAWYFLKRIEEIEAIGVERDLAGIPIATVPAEMLGERASDDDKKMVQSIIKLVQNVRRDEQEGIVWPQAYDAAGKELYTFKLLTSGGTRQFPTDTIISRYESRIAMTVLADWILLGNDAGNGSYALSTSKASMFQSALETWLDVIENVINEHAVPRLFQMNGIKGPYPKFRHDIVQKPSLPDLATLISAMAGAGAQLFPDTGLENHLRNFAELPIREENQTNEAVEEKILAQQLKTQLQQSVTQEELAQRTAQDPNAEGLVPNAQGSVQGQVGAVSQKAPAGGAAGGAGGSPAGQQTGPGGKQPASKPGAPTKSTGPVKSKLPPTKRRATVAVRASQNQTPKSTGGKKTTSVAKSSPDKARAKLKKQLEQDYPERTTKWLDDSIVHSPHPIPMADINQKNRASWAASKSPAKLAHFKNLMRAGYTKPILVTKAPGENRYNIVDGHHRYLAAKSLGADDIHAWVVHVPQKIGEWTHMHSAQSPYGPNGIREKVSKSATLSKDTVDYRQSKDPQRRCGTCSMFRISGDDESGECTLVKGSIDPDDVCNRWTSLKVKKSPDMMVSHFTDDLENTSKPTKKCDYCQRPATKFFYSKQGGGIMARSCNLHVPAARADMRWSANDQISPVNPTPYDPYPRVLTQ